MAELNTSFTSGDLRLAGTFGVPAGVGPAPAVLMLSGSGQTDRDDNAKRLAINLFPPLAATLGESGFATFRYDKPGVGGSGGDYFSSGFDDRLTDTVDAIGWLAVQPQVDPTRIFVVGHSEGALLATRMAAGAAPIAGAVLLAGSARTGEQILLWQAQQILQTLTGVNRWLIKTLRIDPQRSQRKALARIKASSGDTIRVQLRKINAKWMREFLAYDPAPDLAAAKVPILAITGTKDLQVDPADLARMADLIPVEFRSHLVPDLTHLLRADPGRPSLRTYKRQTREPIDPRVVEFIRTWLTSKANTATYDTADGPQGAPTLDQLRAVIHDA